MNKKLMLCKLQLKTVFKSIPRVLVGTLGLGLIVVLVCVFAGAVFKDSTLEKAFNIAIVLPKEGDDYINEAVNYLSQVENINAVCDFIIVDEENAKRGLENGDYVAMLILPNNFAYSLMYGDNFPATFVFSAKDEGAVSFVVREMIKAGATDICTGEACIYAIQDLTRRFPAMGVNATQADEYLSTRVFTFAFNRLNLYEYKDLSETDGLIRYQFYVCTGILLLLALSGISCVNVLKNDSKVMTKMYAREGISSWHSTFFKVFSVSLVYFIIMGVVLLLGSLAGLRISLMKDIFSISSLPAFMMSLVGLFVVVFAVFSFVVFVFKLANNPVISILVVVLLSVVMLYMSGCFIPFSMLPKGVRIIGEFLPTYWNFRLLGQVISGGVLLTGTAVYTFFINVLIAGVFIAMSGVVDRVRDRIGD